MIFGKNRKRMVDVRELQKRGVVRIPKKEIEIPTTKEGFVEIGTPLSASHKSQSNADFFGFMEKSEPTSQSQTFSTESNGYNKREVDVKITDLDNKIYKLEQRIELLERKVGVNQSNNDSNVIGW